MAFFLLAWVYIERKCLGVDDHLDISSIFKISEFEIAGLALFKKKWQVINIKAVLMVLFHFYIFQCCIWVAQSSRYTVYVGPCQTWLSIIASKYGTFFPAIHVNYLCSLICLYTLVAHVANNMDPDQTAPKGAVWSGLAVFASMLKVFWSAFELWSRCKKQTFSWYNLYHRSRQGNFISVKLFFLLTHQFKHMLWC